MDGKISYSQIAGKTVLVSRPIADPSCHATIDPIMTVPSLAFSQEAGAIPALGFGTSPMTGGLAPDTVVAALKAGYRHIDTARKYGTERAVGEAMRASGVPRGDIFLTTKVIARKPARRRLRQIGRRQPRRAQGRLRRSAAGALAQSGDCARARPCRRWPRPSGRGWRATSASPISTSRCSTRRSSFAPSRWSALQAEYHPYLDQTKLLDRGAPARPGLHRLLPARPRPAVQRSGAGRDRQGARQEHRADRAALADAAERRRDSALVESAAHRRQFQGVRFHA